MEWRARPPGPRTNLRLRCYGGWCTSPVTSHTVETTWVHPLPRLAPECIPSVNKLIKCRSRAKVNSTYSSPLLLWQWGHTWLPFHHLYRALKMHPTIIPRLEKCPRLYSLPNCSFTSTAARQTASCRWCRRRHGGGKCRCHTVMRPTGNRYHRRWRDRCGDWAASETSAHHSADRLRWQHATLRYRWPHKRLKPTGTRYEEPSTVSLDYLRRRSTDCDHVCLLVICLTVVDLFYIHSNVRN